MENWDLLACHYQRIVDDFIEAVLDAADLDGVERDVMGVGSPVRGGEPGSCQGLSAVLALLLEADADALARLPGWLDRVQTVLPVDGEFMTEMGWRLDPAGAALADESLALLPGESLAAREFRNCLWELSPSVNRLGRRCYCGFRE